MSYKNLNLLSGENINTRTEKNEMDGRSLIKRREPRNQEYHVNDMRSVHFSRLSIGEFANNNINEWSKLQLWLWFHQMHRHRPDEIQPNAFRARNWTRISAIGEHLPAFSTFTSAYWNGPSQSTHSCVLSFSLRIARSGFTSISHDLIIILSFRLRYNLLTNGRWH